ncbi:hypothetical protein BJV77DRAFT_1159890 [Russula vinacea]|nr:hypothetical protein BJV77DRAFT_1159890 [Russula vinacea]
MGQHLTVPLVTIPLAFSPLDGEDRPATETTRETTLEDRRSTKTLSASECPCQRPNVTHDVLERKRSIAKARRKFALVAVRCRSIPRQTWNLTKPRDATMKWNFIVSDKRNTAPAFTFTTVTTRLAYRPLPTTPCRSTFPENHRSRANRLLQPHTQPVISEADVLAAASPPYLPMRQQDVIHSLIVFASSATTCTNVNCVWSAIAVVTPHDTLCVRCHNETVHRTSNIATTPQPTYPGEIMPELYDIINGITQIEEMEILRSLGSPCFVMRVS